MKIHFLKAGLLLLWFFSFISSAKAEIAGEVKFEVMSTYIKISWDVFQENRYEGIELKRRRVGESAWQSITPNGFGETNGTVNEYQEFWDYNIQYGTKYQYLVVYDEKAWYDGFPTGNNYREEILPGKPTAWGIPSDVAADLETWPVITVNGYAATVQVLYSNRSDKRLKKPLIIVDGFDPLNNRDLFSTKEKNAIDSRGLFALMNGDLPSGPRGINAVGQIRQQCYDLVFVNWHEGAGDVRKNADLFIQVVNLVNQAKVTAEQLVVFGPSMGGLITRLALAKMEISGQNHQTRLYISMDSPHLGGQAPMGVQKLGQIVDNIRGTHTFADRLGSTAAKQMLRYHLFASPDGHVADQDAERYSFINDLNSMSNKGWPMNLRKIAISNGSVLSGTNSLNGGTHIADIMCGALEYDIYAFGRSDNVYMINRLTTVEYNTSLPPILTDNSSGGTINFTEMLRTIVTNNGDDCMHDEDPGLQTSSCFIPINSAFAYNEAAASDYSKYNNGLSADNIHKVWGSQTPSTVNTPFDALFGQTYNQTHCQVDQVTIDWLLQQMAIQDQYAFGDTYFPVQGSSDISIYTGGGSNWAKNMYFASNPNDGAHIYGTDRKFIASKSITLSPGTKVFSLGGTDHPYTAFQIGARPDCYGPITQYSNPAGPPPMAEKTDETADAVSELNIQNVNVYPNPNNGNFTLQLNPDWISGTIVVTDLTGRTMYTDQVRSSMENITADIAAGVYSVTISKGDNKITRKFVVVK